MVTCLFFPKAEYDTSFKLHFLRRKIFFFFGNRNFYVVHNLWFLETGDKNTVLPKDGPKEPLTYI